ncbi:SHOCT domain-containing protein [Rhodococcus koreensis]
MIGDSVVAGTATAVSNRVSRRQGQRWAAEQPASRYESAPAQCVPPQPAAPPAPGVDRISALTQLCELRDHGVLTEQEFTTEKARILAS